MQKHTYTEGKRDDQCGRFSRNIAYVTPKIIHFYYQKNMFVGSKYPKNKLHIFEKKFTGDDACTMLPENQRRDFLFVVVTHGCDRVKVHSCRHRVFKQ